MAVTREVLVDCCEALLGSARVKDYCPNGLQVEGRSMVSRMVTGVTASQALIDAAIDAQADVLLVHHGYFWKGEDARVVGMKKRRLQQLLAHDINLLAYHLPLDIHPEVGNNVQLARQMGWVITGDLQPDAPYSVGLTGELEQSMTAADLQAHMADRLGRPVMHIGGAEDGDVAIKRLAWCTGAAQGYIEDAVAAGVDAFVTGEVSEQTTHQAREYGIHFFAAGHHATERYGVQALGEYLAQTLSVEHQFIDIDNPV